MGGIRFCSLRRMIEAILGYARSAVPYPRPFQNEPRSSEMQSLYDVLWTSPATFVAWKLPH